MSVHHSISKNALISACTLSAAGSLVFNAFPLFLGKIAGALGSNDEQLGMLGTSYLAGFAIVALFAPIWMPRFSWKISAIAGYVLVIAAAALLQTASMTSINYVMAQLGFGSGILFTIALGVVSAARDPDSAYGWKLMAEMFLAGLLMAAMTLKIINSLGYNGFIFGIIFLYGCTTLALINLPRNFLKTEEKESPKAKYKQNNPAILATLALFFQFSIFSGLWAFMERIGTEINIEKDIISSILIASLAAGFIGALTCALMGKRFGQRSPILLSMGLTLICIASFNFSSDVFVFALSACAFNALLQFVTATQMALITELDTNGRFTVMIAFILALGGAAGPGIFGTIIENIGFFGGYLWTAAFTLTAAGLTFLATEQRSNTIQPEKAVKII